MKIIIKRIFALSLALLMTFSLASCGQSCGNTAVMDENTNTSTSQADTQADIQTNTNQTQDQTQAETQANTQANTPVDTESDTQEGSSTEEVFIKKPLEHLIFGQDSYAQGDNLIASLGREQLPQNFPFPKTMTIKNLEQWNLFYGGLPRVIMDEAFVSGINNINTDFFRNKALVLVFLEESSPEYTHAVTNVGINQAKLAISITTHMKKDAKQETAYRCIIIPIDREYASMNIKLSQTRELNGF